MTFTHNVSIYYVNTIINYMIKYMSIWLNIWLKQVHHTHVRRPLFDLFNLISP